LMSPEFASDMRFFSFRTAKQGLADLLELHRDRSSPEFRVRLRERFRVTQHAITVELH
jgi:hypothetical protein